MDKSLVDMQCFVSDLLIIEMCDAFSIRARFVWNIFR
jgi:hypothetical protein